MQTLPAMLINKPLATGCFGRLFVSLSPTSRSSFLWSQYISFLWRKSKHESANKQGIHPLFCKQLQNKDKKISVRNVIAEKQVILRLNTQNHLYEITGSSTTPSTELPADLSTRGDAETLLKLVTSFARNRNLSPSPTAVCKCPSLLTR